MPDPAPFDPERIVRALAHHKVRYVLVGALAARLQGFPRLTADADITPSRETDNLAKLADALRDLQARVYTETVPEGLPFDITAAGLSRSELWNLVTSAGRLDIVFEPSGTRGYEELLKAAVSYEVFGVVIHAASLADIARSKEAAARPQDIQDAELLREMLRREAAQKPKPRKP